jgi:glycosyltransferase involved in cell wall biosynthesis
VTATVPKVFISDAILQERLVIGTARPDQGHAPWGWKALSALYQASLIACGYRIAPIVRPEIYQTDIARRVIGVEPRDWHLAVKPIEHLRPFHGVPNVFVCDWPFSELSGTPLGDSPFFDQVRLLRMADAVACCTDFTTDTLRRAGVERAITLPPHIPPPEGVVPSRRHPSREGTGCRFLSVVDADHLSRQLGSTIEGFAAAATHQDDLRLVICVQGADAQLLADLRQRVAETMSTADADKTISILGAGADSAAGLYAAADFFLCADAAPGLSLPLVQAMQAGLLLVTTMTRGIASFLPPEAAVLIATEPGILYREDEPIARFLPLTTHPPTAATVRDAILVAAALDGNARFHIAAIGQEIAERRFSLEAFKSGLGQLGIFVSPDTP